MPTDVSAFAEIGRPTAIYQHVSELNPPSIPTRPSKTESTPEQTAEVYWRDIQGIIDRAMLGIKKRYPQVEEHSLELIGDLFFAPFRLDVETIETAESPEQKELSARIQANLIDNIFYASMPESDSTFVERVYDIVAMFENIARNHRTVPKVDRIKQFWNGVKAAHAVADVLLENRYKVLLPNYAQEPDDNGIVCPVYEWDVKSGVDFVAERGGHIALIDAKGQKNRPKETTGGQAIERSSVDFDIRSEDLLRDHKQYLQLPKSLRDTIEDFDPISVRRVRIIVPTGSEYLSPLQPTNAVRGRGRRELPQFARLSEQSLKEDVMRGMLQLRI